jgi:hypothetical protein
LNLVAPPLGDLDDDPIEFEIVGPHDDPVAL